MVDLSGRVLRERYRIVRKIGAGAMSEVFLAVHPHHADMRFALKVLRQDLVHQTDLGHRFREEGRVLERLDHPGIVRVHEVFETDGALCMALAFVDGRSLEDMLREHGALDASVALPIFKVVLSALDYAHRSHVIHRDVKPSNILIDREGRALLCDFGIARQIGRRGTTGIGMTLGTPQYMSPEQIQAPQQIDHRSDLYSAGIMLYEMLTGRVPFGDASTDSDYAVLQQHVHTDPPDPRTFNPAIDVRICAVLHKALRKNPGQRFQGGSEFWQAIELAVAGVDPPDEGGRPPPSPSPPSPTSRTVRRRYSVYRHAHRNDEAVKIGFSWPALCLGVVWMFAKRLSGYALAWIGCIVVVAAMFAVVSQMPRDGLTIALYGLLAVVAAMVWVMPALRGNGWRERHLLRRGYVFVGEVGAPTAEVALASAPTAPRPGSAR
ncbi:serine/threonine-protein kinase [Variovorax sp. J22R115]|uniref:serine/threonine-protein kinase n=1 Tax=Variovorax sp. J22R115 TaxID=3053509 RepID=UPI00257671BC|nr:serine/threonine-protein kinase [Variovorax sp. J22R115]MDM0047930.1 serine/threonine-protein kinase [Variovorax sp. J22R115]